MNVAVRIHRRIGAYAFRERRIQRVINLLAIGRLIAFVGLIVTGGFAFDADFRAYGLIGVLLAGGAFLLLMVRQDRCYRFQRKCVLAQELLRDDLARAECRPADIADDRAIAFEDHHPFAHDLDLSGRYSALKLIDDSFHNRAKAMLKRWLDRVDPLEAIRARQRAVRELAGRKRFRLKLGLSARLDSMHDLDPGDLAEWLAEKRPWTIDSWAYLLGRVWSLVTAYTVTVYLINQVYDGENAFWARADFLPWLPILAVQLGLIYGFGVIHKRYMQAFMARGQAFAAACAMVPAFERGRFAAPLLRDLQRALAVGGQEAGLRLNKLLSIHEMLGYRGNALAHFLLNVFFLWDQFWLRRLARWRDDHGDRLPAWLETLFQVEALSALANFDWLFPGRPFPELVNEDRVLVEAIELGHPELPADRRVGNDYQLVGNGIVHLVTGSNMSGKSTFLRTVGVNLALARMGAPVCARSLRCTLPKIWTSIRIQDSLAEGVSYFYAEVRRLKQILEDIAAGEGPVLFLLDEILKGTNSRERQIACKAMIDFLIAHGASGLVTTHDLELLALRDQRPEAIASYHFQELTRDDKMFFDYKLKPGELTSTNALRVMRFAGVPLEFDED